MIWCIDVSGTPAPQGSKRYVGNGRAVESSRGLPSWREAVRAETARTAREHGAPLRGAVNVEMSFFFLRPASHLGRGENYGKLLPSAPAEHVRQPDLDKLVRAVLDGLTMGGAWLDDRQVNAIYASKQYSGVRQGCSISIAGETT